MTIPATASEVTHAANGVTVAFPIPFVFDTSADIKVITTDADGTPTVETTGFTITGGSGSTGTCTFDTAPANNTSVTLLDDPELSQTADYTSNDAFAASSHEEALDKLSRQIKRLHQRVERTLRMRDGDRASGADNLIPLEAARAGMFLGFDSEGNPIALSGAGGADSALRTDLASTSISSEGSLLVGYRAPENNAIAQSVYAILRNWLFVTSFGAIGDDSTDNYAAINLAVAAAVASKKTLCFPAGTYRHSDYLEFGFAGIKVVGFGTVVLKHTGNGGRCVSFDAGVGAVIYNKHFENFTIEGSGAAAQDGLFVRNHVHGGISNIRVKNVSQNAYHIAGDVKCIYTNVLCSDNEGAFSTTPDIDFFITGTALIAQTTACQFIGLIAEAANDYGIYGDQMADCQFLGGVSEGFATGIGVYLHTGATGNTFDGLFCEANPVGGDVRTHGKRNKFKNCSFTSRAAAPPYEDTRSIVVESDSEQEEFEGCAFYWMTIESGAKGARVKRSDCTRVENLSAANDCVVTNTRELSISAAIRPIPMEEFTPTFGGSSANGTLTHDVQIGRYTLKDGWCEFTLSVRASVVTAAPTGDLLVRGLPHTSKAGFAQAVTISRYDNLTLPASRVQVAAEIAENSTTIRFEGLASGLAASLVQGSGLAANGLVVISGRYLIA